MGIRRAMILLQRNLFDSRKEFVVRVSTNVEQITNEFDYRNARYGISVRVLMFDWDQWNDEIEDLQKDIDSPMKHAKDSSIFDRRRWPVMRHPITHERMEPKRATSAREQLNELLIIERLTKKSKGDWRFSQPHP